MAENRLTEENADVVAQGAAAKARLTEINVDVITGALHASIVGATTIVVTPAAAMAVHRKHSIIGGTTIVIVPAATMHLRAHSNALLSQFPVETLTQNTGKHRFAQAPLELLTMNAAQHRLAQAPIEVLTQNYGRHRLSQFLLEVLYIPGGSRVRGHFVG